MKPVCFRDVSSVIKVSLKSHQLQLWKIQAPTVLILVQIIIATAGTSAHAERTFSLDKRLKSFARNNMNDETFDALGLMSWYQKDVDDILNLIHIENKFV